MNEKERLIVLVVGALLSVMVTGVIAYLAITATESGERNLLLGGLVGTGAFGGGALFGLLGTTRPGSGPGPMVNVESPNVDVIATNTAPANGGNAPA